MKVGAGDPTKPTSVRPSGVDRTRTAQSGPSAATDASKDDVKVAVSPTARLLSRVRQGIAAEEVDTARVSRVRDLLERDAYEIDDRTLAQAFIDKELSWTRS